MIYICVFLYTSLCSLLYSKRRKSISRKLTTNKLKNAVGFLVMLLPCILVAGFRYGISIDYFRVYARGFNIIVRNSSKSEFELGFTYLVKLCSKIVNESWFMFLSVSCITVVVYFIAFDISKNYFISVLLFFGAGIYFDSFNGIRQYIVCAIFLYCFRYIKTNDWKKYFVIMGACVLIHTSALFTLPLYFVKKINLNKVYCIIVSCILLIFSKNIYNVSNSKI